MSAAFPRTDLLGGQLPELERLHRLQLESRFWEPAGRALLATIPAPPSARALDVGCGIECWLRVLSEWVGAAGSVTGTDVNERTLAGAAQLVREEHLANVELVRDDLFDSRLPAASFDLVHARFLMAPLGRMEEQVRVHRRLLKPGGWLILEEPDSASWHFDPAAPAAERLIALILQSFRSAGGDPDAGRCLPALLHTVGVQPEIRARVEALPPGHPYQRELLQVSTWWRASLPEGVTEADLHALVAEAQREIAEPGRWSTTLTLIQAYGRT